MVTLLVLSAVGCSERPLEKCKLLVIAIEIRGYSRELGLKPIDGYCAFQSAGSGATVFYEHRESS